jgi:hypothetical protein
MGGFGDGLDDSDGDISGSGIGNGRFNGRNGSFGKEIGVSVTELVAAAEGIMVSVEKMMITILTQLHKHEKICSEIMQCCLR